MPQTELISADMKVLMNHIYEYQKGVRQMVLYTFNKKYEQFAIARLERQHIDYLIKPVGKENLNLFFGKKECLNAIRMMINRPLNELSPEEDFILGAMLGYDIFSSEFEGKARLARHRLIKDGLKAQLASNELHALSISVAATPAEWAAKQQ